MTRLEFIIYASLPGAFAAVAKMVHVDDEFYPNPENTGFYNRLNNMVYRHVNPHFDPILKTLSELVD